MKRVRMRHPDPDVRDIDVPASAVPHHGAAGWEVVPEEEVQAQARAEQDPKKTATSRKRTTKESE